MWMRVSMVALTFWLPQLPHVTAYDSSATPECIPSNTYLNAVIDTVMQQTAKFDTQTELFNRLMDTNANTTINNSTLAPVQTDLELLLDPQYWNALGSTFVDVNSDGIPDAFEDGTLTSDEIRANPQSQIFLKNLARNIAQQHGVPASQITVASVTATTTALNRRRLAESGRAVPVTLVYNY